MQAAPVALAPHSAEERRSVLSQHLVSVAARGGRVVARSDFSAVVAYGKPVNHLLHFVIGIFTCTMWWFVWLLLALTGGEKRRSVVVNEYGQVTEHANAASSLPARQTQRIPLTASRAAPVSAEGGVAGLMSRNKAAVALFSTVLFLMAIALLARVSDNKPRSSTQEDGRPRSQPISETPAQQQERELRRTAAYTAALLNFRWALKKGGLWGTHISDADFDRNNPSKLTIVVGNGWFSMSRAQQAQAANVLGKIWTDANAKNEEKVGSPHIRIISPTGSTLGSTSFSGEVELEGD